MSDKKVIGILGGMGPLATADLFQKITLHTAASCDQDHPRVCIDSNTNISDRTAALLHGGADPVPEMVKSAQRLESIGADLLIMPCNTAHNFYDAVASSVSIPVLHMIAITRDALRSRGVKCAGLLATDGTVQTGIYQRTFEGSGVELLTPDHSEDQAAVMDIIYNGVKAGDLTHRLRASARARSRGPDPRLHRASPRVRHLSSRLPQRRPDARAGACCRPRRRLRNQVRARA
jgi:aspartate racemase